MEDRRKNNPLGTMPVVPLMIKFAIPSIIAMLVSAVYNIVDQFFIGHYVGTLGNAATSIAFPLAMFCTSIGLLFGIGGASAFNLTMGEGDHEKAIHYIGNALICLIIGGIGLTLFTEISLNKLIMLFGASEAIFPYAKEYIQITAIGFTFLILTIGGGHLIRADGSPRMTMICSLSGAIINTFLDALFVIVFGWGMRGAALATIIGQIFSGFLIINYMRHYKTVPLLKKHMKLEAAYVIKVMSLGFANCINQLAMMLTSITLNNSLKYYGGLSEFGQDIPIACSGIVTKVNQIFFSVIIGLSQSSQPVESFNYGAKQYKRVREAYKVALFAGAFVSIGSFILFQTMPRQILALFQNGSEEYYRFGSYYFRIFLFFTCVNCLQPITSNLFTAIGKPIKGTFLSLTRQILFLLPMLLILPRFFGIYGVLYAGPVADGVAAVCTVIMAVFEFKDMYRREKDLLKNR